VHCIRNIDKEHEMPQTANTLSGDTTLVLPEFDAPPADPLGLLRSWIESAKERGVREPLAASLATADAAGRPSSRVLLIKELDERGLVFTSFTGSRKGLELAERPFAVINFYWRETLQQVTVSGRVEILAAAESDRLFAERPLAARATTAVSRQSRPLADEAQLKADAATLIARGEVDRPAEWTGYRLVPDIIEFWYGSPDRLHRRLRYEFTRSAWANERLQP
jgi:dihydrophenazinedicarboxylate synthase